MPGAGNTLTTAEDAMSDELKNLNYRWNVGGRFWGKTVMAEGFSFEALLRQPWARWGDQVAVYRDDGEMVYSRAQQASGDIA